MIVVVGVRVGVVGGMIVVVDVLVGTLGSVVGVAGHGVVVDVGEGSG